MCEEAIKIEHEKSLRLLKKAFGATPYFRPEDGPPMYKPKPEATPDNPGLPAGTAPNPANPCEPTANLDCGGKQSATPLSPAHGETSPADTASPSPTSQIGETAPDMTRVKIVLKSSGYFPKGLGYCKVSGRNVDMATRKYLPDNWREQLEKKPGTPIAELVPYVYAPPEEILPDMRYVVWTSPPREGYPEGLGSCNITRQSVNMATRRYLNQNWTQYPDAARDLKRLQELKKKK